jgi:hypothetical protein
MARHDRDGTKHQSLRQMRIVPIESLSGVISILALRVR